jgi:hypothetical protein
MKMYACGWKKYDNEYAVQVNEIKKGDKTELKKLFKDWSESSIGWNAKNGHELIIYCKKFENQKEWLSWAKKCPIKLSEVKVKSSGESEYVQLSCKEKKRGKK